MKLRFLCIACIVFALVAGWCSIQLTHTARTALLNEARADDPRANDTVGRVADSPEAPRPLLQPHLLFIEADWSKSPTASEVKSDLQQALAGVPLPKHLRGDLLKDGPRILFSEDSIEFYQPRSCAEFMAWLDRHKLIRKKLSFPEAVLKAAQYPGGMPGFESNLVDAELHPVSKDWESKPRPFVEVRERRKWQVFSNFSSNWIEMYAGMERVRVELGQPNADWAENIRVLGRISGRRAGESLFASGTIDQSRGFDEPAAEGELSEADAANDVETFPVFWLQAPEARNENGATARLRIPDRLQAPQLVIGNFPARGAYLPAAVDNPLAPSTQRPSVPAGGSPTPAPGPATSGKPVSASALSPNGLDFSKATDQRFSHIAPEGSRIESAGLKALRNEFRQLDARAFSLAEETRATTRNRVPGFDQAEQREALRTAVSQAFVAGQKLHEAELTEFRGRMQRLQETIDRRSRISEKIIDRRVDDLLDPSLSWIEQALANGTTARNEAMAVLTPGGAASPAPRKAARRPFQSTVTVGVISEIRDDGTVVVSCMEPGEIQVGEELVLSCRDLWVPGQNDRVGWIEITRLEDAETAIGRPFELVRELKDNRFSNRQPKPGDSVERPNYGKPKATAPVSKESGEPPVDSGQPRASIDGVWILERPLYPGMGVIRCVFWKDSSAVFARDERIKLHRVTVDLSKTPHQIQLRDASTGENRHGIFEIADDHLRMTVVPESEPMPVEFKDPLQEFVRASRDVPQKLLGAMAASNKVSAEQLRRSFPTTVTAGAITEVRDDGTIVISCRKPRGIHVGEELVLSTPGPETPGRHVRIGWVRITSLVDDQTAVGKPFEMVRRQLANRIVDWQPKPGDSVDRPVYDDSPTVDEADELPAGQAKPGPAVGRNVGESPENRIPTVKAAPGKLRRRPIPLSSDVGLISAVREDGTVVISCKEPGDVQVGEELILSWISKEGGGTYKPAGWVRITSLENPDTAIGKPFEFPRVQIENRFVDRLPQLGDHVSRPITEKVDAIPE